MDWDRARQRSRAAAPAVAGAVALGILLLLISAPAILAQPRQAGAHGVNGGAAIPLRDASTGADADAAVAADARDAGGIALPTATLRILVRSLASDRGLLRCALFDRADGFPKNHRRALRTLPDIALTSRDHHAESRAFDGGRPLRTSDAGPGLDNAAIRHGEGVCEFRGVPPGRYAISLFHDENANGVFDVDPYGIPTEGFAWSIDRHAGRTPAPFGEASFDLPAGLKVVRLSILP